MEKKNSFPFEIRDLEPEKVTEIARYFKGPEKNFVQVGPEKYLFNTSYKCEGANIYNMEIRPTDIFVTTFPKSGTTWTQELVWLLGNNFDYETAKAVPQYQRFPILEITTTTAAARVSRQTTNVIGFPDEEMLKAAPSPRFIKTHLPLSLLPPRLLDTARVVYVARDPRDVAVSYYHYMKLMLRTGFEEDFKTFWHLFTNGLVSRSPYFAHVKESWAMRNHPNLLFLFYEELYKDLPASVRRVASFLNKPVTESQVAQLCDHLSIDNFKKNKSVNFEVLREHGLLRDGHCFIRKGKAGGWRDYFDDEMAAQAQQWIDDNLRGTDLRFPDVYT